MEAVRDDMLLPGRGVARIVYEPVIAKRMLERATPPEAGGAPVFLLDGRPVEPDGFDGDAAWVEEVADERVFCRHVFWKDYREQPARCWDEVGWIAFRHSLARDRLVERFGAAGREIPLESAVSSYGDRERAEAAPEDARRGVVWEIWDKAKRRRIVIAEGFDRVVEETDDPLGLTGFFPIPEPLYAVKTSDTRVPIPEFTLYQDQALELDELATRKRHLIAALRARGVYAGVLGEVERLLTEGGENEMIPVKDWDQFRDKGGLAAAIEWLPIERIAQVIASLNTHIAQLKGEIFEITGLSDIVRGSTHASETATAQRLKGSFGTMRMQPRQRPMQRFVRDALRLKAEVIAEHFRPETLARMTGRPVPPAVTALLRDERLRGFRIDIETESTVQPDAEAERRNAVEFLTASTQFFTGIAPLIAGAPQSAPMFLEMFRTAARSFKPRPPAGGGDRPDQRRPDPPGRGPRRAAGGAGSGRREHAMTRYAWSTAEGRWVPLGETRPAARLQIVNRDAAFADSVVSMADGERYRSRRDWDEHLRARGMVEIGNDAVGPSIPGPGATRDEQRQEKTLIPGRREAPYRGTRRS